MTFARVDLVSTILTTLAVGVMLALSQWLIAALLGVLALFCARSLWRLGGRRVEVAVSAAEAAESDPGAHAARRASGSNGGLRGPHTGSERT